MSDTLTLANLTISALANPEQGVYPFMRKRDLGSGETNKKAIAQSKVTMKDIVNSQKFFIDNNLIKTAMELSSQQPHKLIPLIERAIPPFNNMWIEWDEKQRFAITGEDDSQIFYKIGYHIQKINGHYLYSQFSLPKADATKNKIVCLSSGFYLQNNGLFDRNFLAYVDYFREFNYDKKRALLSNQTFTKGLLGKRYYGIWKDTTSYKRLVNFLMHKVLTAQTVGNLWMRSDQSLEGGFDYALESERASHELLALDGDLRLLIGILSLFNYDHIVYNNAKPNRKINHLRYGSRVAKHDYKLVTIDLPKPNVRKVYKGLVSGNGSPKAEHMRRGHWRVQPIKGGKKRIWIEPQKVGNAKFGTVEIEYALQGKKGA
tara:strand:- start:8605 stop:9726 length:1122 start_codon:yes stop_codon:yes gene_type:complete